MGFVLAGRRSLLVAVGLALAVGLAGCGGSQRAAPPPATPKPPAPLVVSVVDGDTGKPVPQARVRSGRHAARSNAHGLAELRVRGPIRLLTVAASGYVGRALRTPSAEKLVVRLYRPATQWPVYGATPARTQAQTAIRLRPPFET